MKYLLAFVENHDESIFYYINNRLKCPVLDFIMPKITHLGGTFFDVPHQHV
ncbi:MAG: hypothetical protein PWR06_712 [Thermoanaerobacteraceae bacterium]|nr:hypothetical protein [Thermoanaerobacteraceae bacterium]